MDMAPSNLVPCLLLILFIIQPVPTTSNVLSPFLSPIAGNVCKDVDCGRGICKESNATVFMYECTCDSGWRQSLSPGDDNFKFLPCVIPNCSLDTSCSEGMPPSQEKSREANESILSPCHWADCGGGTCNHTSLLTYSCMCEEGYYNLLNITIFPCYKECAIGLDCPNLGIGSSNESTPSPANLDLPKNESSVLRGRPSWMIPLLMMVLLRIINWWK